MVAGNQVKARLTMIFSADLRSLALLRIGIALLVLVDLLQRSQDLMTFYGDDGVFPRATMSAYVNSLPDLDLPLASATMRAISIHEMSGLWQIEATLFGIAGIMAVLL